MRVRIEWNGLGFRSLLIVSLYNAGKTTAPGGHRPIQSRHVIKQLNRKIRKDNSVSEGLVVVVVVVVVAAAAVVNILCGTESKYKMTLYFRSVVHDIVLVEVLGKS